MKTKIQVMNTKKPDVHKIVYGKASEYEMNLTIKTSKGDRKLSWDITEHARKRISQRMRNYKAIMLVMEYGKTVFKQSLTFYIATKKSFPRNFDKSLLKELNNTVVVESNDGAIITCYKNAKSLKHIMKKQKYLANAA